MGRMKKLEAVPTEPSFSPAKTDEERMKQCIALAYDCVEKRLRDGSASSQEVCHFLKLATEQSELEREKLKSETTLANAKVEALKAQEKQELDYGKVLTALRRYGGTNDTEF